MTDLLIGCPVRRREWVLRPWFLCADQAAQVAGLEANYLVALSPADVASREVIEKCCADAGRQLTVLETDELTSEPVQRLWNEIRYKEMVRIRNQLLAEVRRIQPRLFLSLDSDILLHERVIANLVANLDRFDAVGGKCYMTAQGTHCPSYAMFLNANGLLRPDTDWVIPVDVIMAIKLMTSAAYVVDYQLHYQGEDAGWSAAATQAGVRLGWNGTVCSKHVMAQEQLEMIDMRCGY
jgi:hypothetical protein